MSPKEKPKSSTKHSNFRELVRVGPREVIKSSRSRWQGERDENGLRPSTSRALVLRNGKYGARGTGELMVVNRISGREKLDLLAEDLVAKSKKAVMSPLRLEECFRVADSQFNAYLDDIAILHDPELFHVKIQEELRARAPYDVNKGTNGSGSMHDPAYIASIVSIRIHNTYMLASAWKVVLDILQNLRQHGLQDGKALVQLKDSNELRKLYLSLCRTVNVLVEVGQQKFSVAATTTPHYVHYFKRADTDAGSAVTFDWAGLKDACRSFLDSIIIELCFPHAPYPKRVLYQILHDAVTESPGEARRFPQAMWDAVGDLSVTVQLQELLESPLLGLGPDAQKWQEEQHEMPEAFERWVDAQIVSQEAADHHAGLADIIVDLARTKSPDVLGRVWAYVNTSYRVVCGVDVDGLWQLQDSFDRPPQWTSFFMPQIKVSTNHNSDSDSDGPPGLLGASKKRAQRNVPKKVPLQITDGREKGGDDSDGSGHDSLPGLQSMSGTSDESEDLFEDREMFDDMGSDYDEEEDDGYDDDETEYDSEEEAEYRELMREAMDAAMAIPDFFDAETEAPEFDATAEERKGNPFLKLLGSLRGRVFSANPKLSADAGRKEPRPGTFSKPLSVASPPKAKAASKAAPVLTIDFSNVPEDELPPLQPAPKWRRKDKIKPARSVPTSGLVNRKGAAEAKNMKASVEDVDDDTASVTSTSSKKKKKKSKKKSLTSVSASLPPLQEDESAPAIVRPSTPPKPLPPSPVTPSKKAAKSSPSSPPKTAVPSWTRASNGTGSTTTLPHMSNTPLAPPYEQTVAQSARSYLQEMEGPKAKIKSRPDHASIFSTPEKNGGFFSKLTGKGKTKEEGQQKEAKRTWFSKLTKKTTRFMHQLLNTSEDDGISPMKWENFLKVMREMGFTYDPSTAGSSVRFDPPGGGDRSITFHKPHPDPTLHPIMLREFGKKLKDYYGWTEAELMKLSG